MKSIVCESWISTGEEVSAPWWDDSVVVVSIVVGLGGEIGLTAPSSALFCISIGSVGIGGAGAGVEAACV